jgi:hypothetical protein
MSENQPINFDKYVYVCFFYTNTYYDYEVISVCESEKDAVKSGLNYLVQNPSLLAEWGDLYESDMEIETINDFYDLMKQKGKCCKVGNDSEKGFGYFGWEISIHKNKIL